MIVFVLAIGVVLVGVLFGGILARVYTPRVALIASLILFGVATIMLVIGSQMDGWDGLGYLIPALVVVAPMGLGAGLAGLIAAYGQRRR